MSIEPKRSTVAATQASACSGSPALATCQATSPARSPAAPSMANLAWVRASAFLEEIITEAPASANDAAMAWPMPREAPVINAVLPSSRSSMAANPRQPAVFGNCGQKPLSERRLGR